MKNRKNLGCRIKGTKERGAWAELYFMRMAMSQGLRVSSPYGGLGPYDVGVEDGTGPILRVQVKCTLYQCCAGSYCMSITLKMDRRGGAAGTRPARWTFSRFTLFRRMIGTSCHMRWWAIGMRMCISGRDSRGKNMVSIERPGIYCRRRRRGEARRGLRFALAVNGRRAWRESRWMSYA